MGKDVFFYSISIDPKNDTPEAMKAYMEKYHIGPGWLFLTGKVEDIKLIAQKLGLSSLTDFANRDGHMPSLMIGNEPSGRWMRQSAVDNSRFLAAQIGNFFGWRNAVPLQSYAVLQEPPKVDEGARAFKNRCAVCHTVGKGDSVGPDLANVTKRREHCWVRTYAAPVATPRAGKGEFLFNTRCASCHSIGKGDGLGPDLVNVTTLRERAWLARYVAEPDRMLAEGDGVAAALFAKYKDVRMPNLDLNAEDVALLVSYIEKESKAVVAQANKDVPPAQ